MEIIGKALKCSICKNILISPVMLACGESICKMHVVEKTQILCIVCEEDHSIPKEGLIPNNKLEQIIQTNIGNYAFGDEYKNAWNRCKEVEKMLEDVDLLKRDPCFYICKIIGDLKREVDLKKDELTLRINEEADALINQLIKLEVDCKANLKEKEFLAFVNELEANTRETKANVKEWSNDLRILDNNENKWRDMKEELEKIMKHLQAKLSIVKEEMLLNRKLKVEVEKSHDFLKLSITEPILENLSSKIINWRLTNRLFKLCELATNQKWNLLYRASEHGFHATNFHAKCNGKPKTLTLIKSSNGSVFGAYTEENWESCLGEKYYHPVYINQLSLISSDNKQPANIIENTQLQYYTINLNSLYGPTYRSEMMINNDEKALKYYEENNMKIGYSKVFLIPKCAQGSNESNIGTGSIEEFEVVDVEVFVKN